MGSIVRALLQSRWLTSIAFVVTVVGFGLQQKESALLGVLLFATDLVFRARRAFRTPRPPGELPSP